VKLTKYESIRSPDGSIPYLKQKYHKKLQNNSFKIRKHEISCEQFLTSLVFLHSKQTTLKFKVFLNLQFTSRIIVCEILNKTSNPYLFGVGELVVGLELVVDLGVLLLEAARVQLRDVVIASRSDRRRNLLRRCFVLVEGGGVQLGNILDWLAASGALKFRALLLSL
jgi:hypothetical protein